MPSRRKSQRPRLVTQRLIDYATVLHVGTFALEQEEEAGGAARRRAAGRGAADDDQRQVGHRSRPSPPDIVTLIVTPQDALAMNWAIKAGVDLVLTLRAPRRHVTDRNDQRDAAVPGRQLQHHRPDRKLSVSGSSRGWTRSIDAGPAERHASADAGRAK